MIFRCFAFRFTFTGLESVFFPAGAAGNAFRGAFGHIFRRMVCQPDCPRASSCPHRQECSYARLFEPVCLDGPSGLADAPRPFLIRASALDGQAYGPGETFGIDIHLFDPQAPPLEPFVNTFRQLAIEGIGAERGRIQLEAVVPLDAARRPAACSEPVEIVLDAPPTADPRDLTLRFTSPTELKSGGAILPDAPFSVVLARARDRIATLSALYAGDPLPLDFRGMAERAAMVETVESRLEWRHFQRRSSRTRQQHALSGFVGEVQYRGDIGEFLPLLQAAYWTGIGRHTVWGKGAVEIG